MPSVRCIATYASYSPYFDGWPQCHVTAASLAVCAATLRAIVCDAHNRARRSGSRIAISTPPDPFHAAGLSEQVEYQCLGSTRRKTLATGGDGLPQITRAPLVEHPRIDVGLAAHGRGVAQLVSDFLHDFRDRPLDGTFAAESFPGSAPQQQQRVQRRTPGPKIFGREVFAHRF